MKRVLFFTHHIAAVQNPNGYRIGQYFPYLEAAGFSVDVLTTKAAVPVLARAVRKADVVYVQRLLPDPARRYLLKALGRRIVFDFDDAIMYGTGQGSRTRARRFGAMMRLSDAVLAGNDFLRSEAEMRKGRNVFRVPTVVDTDDYPVKEHREGPFVVGWIGGASTLRYLPDVSPLFEAPPARTAFKAVADRPPEIGGIAFEKWSGAREKEMLLGFDVGIMPTRDDVWSRGKCGLKLIQYCASGLPSISHPFGVSKEIIEDGGNGFLKPDIEGWREGIERLRDDPDLRGRMGRRARAVAEERYSLKVWGPRVAAIIDGL